MAFDILEKHVEARLIRRAKECGGRAYKFVSPGMRSVPDRIVILPYGHLFFAELKRPGGVATEKQKLEHDRLRKLFQSVYVLDSYETVDFIFSIYEILTRKVSHTSDGIYTST